MLANILLAIPTLLIYLLAQFLALFNFLLPHQVPDAINWLFGYFTYLNGIFPIDTLMQAFALVMAAWTLIYFVKIGLMIIGAIPWIGAKFHLPDHKSGMKKKTR